MFIIDNNVLVLKNREISEWNSLYFFIGVF